MGCKQMLMKIGKMQMKHLIKCTRELRDQVDKDPIEMQKKFAVRN